MKTKYCPHIYTKMKQPEYEVTKHDLSEVLLLMNNQSLDDEPEIYELRALLAKAMEEARKIDELNELKAMLTKERDDMTKVKAKMEAVRQTYRAEMTPEMQNHMAQTAELETILQNEQIYRI